MRILQIGTTDKRGGAALVSWKIKERLDKENVYNSMFVADKLSADKNVFSIKRNTLRKYTTIILGRDFYDTDWILDREEFKKADLVHFHNIHGRYFNLSTFKKICAQKPVVWTLHDEWAITSHSVYTFETEKISSGFFESPNDEMPERVLPYNKNILANFKKKILSNSNFSIVTPSLWLKNRVDKSYLKNKNAQLIYNGIDNKKFKKIDKIEARKKLSLPLDKKIVFSLSDGGVGSPSWKGWKYTAAAIENSKNNKNIVFLSAGNENIENKQKDNIIYVGLINNDDLFYYFSACDILLNTSIADNFPLIILEAMSCGLPIVSFDVGGVKEAVLHRENGFIAKYADTEDIIVWLDYALKLDKDEYNKISDNCISRVNQKFTTEKMTENYIQIYKSLIKQDDNQKTN